MTVRRLLAVPLFLAPLPAAAQHQQPQAAWAQERRQPFCIYDGLLATEGGIETAQPARLDTVRAECRARFGWTEAQAEQGIVLTTALIAMRNSQAEAVAAGVDPDILQAVFASFPAEEVASLPIGGPGMAESGPRIGRQVGERLAQRGLSGARADKAARAVIDRIVAARVFMALASQLNMRMDN